LHYKERDYSFEIQLCNECAKLMHYSLERLMACPHDEKPKCRTCTKPCYAKKEWKMVASVMRYSGTKTKIKQLKDFFKIS